ncbi:hypothetical protein [Roseateles noduli]|uniref:hypothetical protein n=1 Tax=Roseateles noduli TaxID=2052484 RepID=UPI003D659CC7
MTDDQHKDDVHRLLTELQGHASLMSEALYSMHLQTTHMQAVLCALVDTHPDPNGLLASFRTQIDHTRALVRPRGVTEFDHQTEAWVERIAARLEVVHRAHGSLPAEETVQH